MADMSLKCEAEIRLVSPGSGFAQNYKMTGTCAAIFEMEQFSGRGFFALADRLREQQASLTDLAAIVTAGLKAGGEEQATPAAVADMLFHTGLGNVLAPIDIFMQRLLLGGRDLGELLAEVRAGIGPETDSTSDDTSESAQRSSAGPSENSGEQPPPQSTPQSTGGTPKKAAKTRTKSPTSKPGRRKSKPGS